MSEKPTIEQYKQNIEEGDFQAYKCVGCGTIKAIPTGSCYSCGGNEMEWARVSGKGNLVSFTVIHVAPEEFQDEAPYIVAIVELEEGTRVSARLVGFDPLKPEEIKLSIPLRLEYEKGSSGRTYLSFRPV
ncbi:MAG: OB-fold domain-containing protein [Candidatus Thorarchaeota archaeon]|nr:MAG: OB-fold domain-containing protein [Candidatus Thorarchaeota archaeon]